MNRKHEQPASAVAPASATYEAAFEPDLAGMTVAEFMRLSPHFAEEEARARIATARATVGRLTRAHPSADVFDGPDLGVTGTPEDQSDRASPGSI